MAMAIWHEPSRVRWLEYLTFRNLANAKPVNEDHADLKPLSERVILEAANALIGSTLFEWGRIRGAILPAYCPLDERKLFELQRWTPTEEETKQLEDDLRLNFGRTVVRECSKHPAVGQSSMRRGLQGSAGARLRFLLLPLINAGASARSLPGVGGRYAPTPCIGPVGHQKLAGGVIARVRIRMNISNS